eukprot:4797440-Pleurochrysis_carterae.AAC.2
MHAHAFTCAVHVPARTRTRVRVRSRMRLPSPPDHFQSAFKRANQGEPLTTAVAQRSRWYDMEVPFIEKSTNVDILGHHLREMFISSTCAEVARESSDRVYARCNNASNRSCAVSYNVLLRVCVR